MAVIVGAVARRQGESDERFKARCSDALMAAVVTDESAWSIGRTRVTPQGLESCTRWGSFHEGVPSEICVLAWWTKEDARRRFHTFEESALQVAVAAALEQQVAG